MLCSVIWSIDEREVFHYLDVSYVFVLYTSLVYKNISQAFLCQAVISSPGDKEPGEAFVIHTWSLDLIVRTLPVFFLSVGVGSLCIRLLLCPLFLLTDRYVFILALIQCIFVEKRKDRREDFYRVFIR